MTGPKPSYDFVIKMGLELSGAQFLDWWFNHDTKLALALKLLLPWPLCIFQNLLLHLHVVNAAKWNEQNENEWMSESSSQFSYDSVRAKLTIWL